MTIEVARKNTYTYIHYIHTIYIHYTYTKKRCVKKEAVNIKDGLKYYIEEPQYFDKCETFLPLSNPHFNLSRLTSGFNPFWGD